MEQTVRFDLTRTRAKRDIVGRMTIPVILAILALVVAIINAVNGKAPLWIAVALLATWVSSRTLASASSRV